MCMCVALENVAVEMHKHHAHAHAYVHGHVCMHTHMHTCAAHAHLGVGGQEGLFGDWIPIDTAILGAVDGSNALLDGSSVPRTALRSDIQPLAGSALRGSLCTRMPITASTCTCTTKALCMPTHTWHWVSDLRRLCSLCFLVADAARLHSRHASARDYQHAGVGQAQWVVRRRRRRRRGRRRDASSRQNPLPI